MMDDLTTISILGSTGSIGTQSLQCADNLHMKVKAISVGKNIKLAEEQIRRYSPEICSVASEEDAKLLKIAVKDTSTEIIGGKNAAVEAASVDVDVCLNSISGFAGLAPTIAAAGHAHRLALANQEPLVAAGETVKRELKKNGCQLLPVDSEHSAVFQCLDGHASEVKKLILTCSGGAFFGKTASELRDVTPAQALGHPTWNMGGKITIDCATLMNKGLEVIEAMHLFDITPDKIDVVIHRESIIHSMVEFCDNAVLAQMGVPDMRIPIQYALTYPNRKPSLVPPLDLISVGKLTFYKPDTDTFPSLALAFDVAEKGGILPCVMNAANEAAVRLFFDGKITFGQIYDTVEKTVASTNNRACDDVNEIIAISNDVYHSVISSVN
ncbi:MAG: 1-deoxy-D-xylulose-5-phosphate reductoisomerase [Clostridia bacterium]|nr:1-deoxy-D-xylulose-5-phosphate reductoisomerase [Clostridia bacterium]